MKIKQGSLIALLVGVLFITIGVIVPFVALQNYVSKNGAIGIIGGADTPTYEFVALQLMNGWTFIAILFGVTLAVSALFCLVFSKTVKNNCSIKTTSLSLGISAVGAMGLIFVFLWFTIVSFHEISKHPVAYPISIILGLFCSVIFIVLIAVYLKLRKTDWSIKGLFIDILTSIIYLPTFFYTFSYLCEVLS